MVLSKFISTPKGLLKLLPVLILSDRNERLPERRELYNWYISSRTNRKWEIYFSISNSAQRMCKCYITENNKLKTGLFADGFQVAYSKTFDNPIFLSYRI